jgi:hypothetical protein|tara:strand:+ start:4526 stop:4867 length:342 start_codon:yes stop_codon:yes gene_type:complete
MENEDLNAIKAIILEFEGETVLGKHMFKAIKAYFKQKKEKTVLDHTYVSTVHKSSLSSNTDRGNIDKILQGADIALKKYGEKLRKKRGKNVITKSKKKAYSKRAGRSDNRGKQ